MLWFTLIGVILIIYGLFSRYMAFGAIHNLNRKETDITSEYEVITVSGNKIEYYIM